jgi:hypothetical protein
MFVATAGAAHAAVTISSAPTSNMSCVSGTCAPTAANAVLNVGDLQTMLASSNVTVNTGTGSLPAQVEDVLVTAPFNWASANSLTLDAYRSVTVSAPVAVNGSAPVSLVTNDGGSGGTLSFVSGGSVAFLGTGNSLSINSKAYILENSIATLAAAIAHKSSGYYALSASYNASHDGTYKTAPIPTKFKGVFNGLGNAISNLTIKGSNKEFGLFADVDANGAINSLRLPNVTITAQYAKEKTGYSVGAVAALNFGSVFNSFASGQIDATSGKYDVFLGGLVGGNAGTIVNSSADTNLKAKSGRLPRLAVTGGLVGTNSGTMDSSYATGATSVATEGFSGGIVGTNSGIVENCYAEGAVSVSNDSYSGGLAGLTYSTIISAYSTGTSSAGSSSDVGGFVGNDDSSGNLSDDLWDTTTSGITNLSQGAGNIANDPGITGETTTQLQSALPAGFDPTIWAENPSINGGLPYLINNPPQ